MKSFIMLHEAYGVLVKTGNKLNTQWQFMKALCKKFTK